MTGLNDRWSVGALEQYRQLAGQKAYRLCEPPQHRGGTAWEVWSIEIIGTGDEVLAAVPAGGSKAEAERCLTQMQTDAQ